MRAVCLTVLMVCGACASDRTPAGAAGDAAEQWYFWTDDGVRHYVYEAGRAAGPGDTVIAIHGGWGAEHSYLLRPLSTVQDRYRVVFYDQRGSLRTPAPDSTIRLQRFVADLEHLRKTLGLEQVTLVAHSMGGNLAYAYLNQYPDRVRGLVLLGTVYPFWAGGGPNIELLREIWPDADSSALAERNRAFFRELGQRVQQIADREGLLPDSLRGVPAESLNLMAVHRDRDRTRAWRIQFAAVNTCNADRWREMEGGQAFYSQNVANNILRDSTYHRSVAALWPALLRFQGPVRVIYGTCDYVDLGPEIWPRIVERLADGAITVLQGAGHSSWLGQPEAFEAALRKALAEAAGR